jgi:hypothetical protein
MDREKTKITVDLYTDSIAQLKEFSSTKKYAHMLREIVDIGIHFYKEGARVSPSVTMNSQNKNIGTNRDSTLENILE